MVSRLNFQPVASLALCLAIASPALAGPPALDDLLRHPGDYSQICDARLSPFPAPIPGFRPILQGEASFSVQNKALMKAYRAHLLSAIANKLETIDLAKKPVPPPPDPSIPRDQIDVEPIGADPTVFSTLLLTMIEELDAWEVFPQLMAFEKKYHALLTAAELDARAPLPQSDGPEGAGVGVNLLKEGEEYDKLSTARTAEVERKTSLFHAQALQRDILAVLVRSMRKQGYGPMLASDLEKTYGRLLKEKWGTHEDFSKYKKAADIPAEERESIKFDPVHQVAYAPWDPVEIPYSEATRQAILDLATSYVASLKK